MRMGLEQRVKYIQFPEIVDPTKNFATSLLNKKYSLITDLQLTQMNMETQNYLPHDFQFVSRPRKSRTVDLELNSIQDQAFAKQKRLRRSRNLGRLLLKRRTKNAGVPIFVPGVSATPLHPPKLNIQLFKPEEQPRITPCMTVIDIDSPKSPHQYSTEIRKTQRQISRENEAFMKHQAISLSGKKGL